MLTRPLFFSTRRRRRRRPFWNRDVTICPRHNRDLKIRKQGVAFKLLEAICAAFFGFGPVPSHWGVRCIACVSSIQFPHTHERHVSPRALFAEGSRKKGERRTISFRSRCAVRVLIIDVPLHLKTKSFLLLRFPFILLLQIGNIENKLGVI